jgi:hypothetical protein
MRESLCDTVTTITLLRTMNHAPGTRGVAKLSPMRKAKGR